MRTSQHLNRHIYIFFSPVTNRHIYFTSVSAYEEGMEETGALSLGTCSMIEVRAPQGLRNEVASMACFYRS